MNFKKSKTSKVVSGVVGLATALMMMGPAVASAATVEELTAQINALLAQVQALQAAQTSTPAATTGYVYSVDLTIGSKGDDVVALQTYLVSGGFLTMPAGVAMGYFGNLTKSAVAAWQAANGISPAAGYFGPKSRAAMNAMAPAPTTTTTTTTPTTTETTTTTTTSTSLPTGCTSTVGYSPITGVSCATGTTSVSSAGVSASIDSANAVAKTIISGQGVATIGGFKIMNGGSAAAKVTALKFKRTGVSSDATLNNVYLYDSMGNRLTDAASIATGVINFSDSAGLVTVPAGGSVVVLVRADVAGSTNGQTIGVMFTDATADGSAVGGTPISGPEHTIAAAPTGMATAQFNGVTPVDNASLDPQNDYTVWQSTVSIGSRDTLLSAIRFQQIGSVYQDDVQNFRLMVDGVAVGSAVAKADANRFVSFNFASPVTVKAGSHVVKLVADIISGSTRTFKFSLRRVVDVELWDSQLSVVVTPTVTGNDGDVAAMTNFPMNAGDITIAGGTITITKATDSPSGNVVDSGTAVTLAKFKVKAQGEKLKVENLRVSMTHSDTGGVIADDANKLRNGALFVDGVQVGSTANICEDSASGGAATCTVDYTEFNLGSSMVLDAGKEYVLEVRGDVFDADGTDNMSADDTLTINLVAGNSNIYKMSSLGYLSNTAVSGNQLTVASGSLTLAKYSAYANQTITLPQTAYKIGEYRLTVGSTEGVNVDTINVDLDTSSTTESFLQDVYIVYGGKTSTPKAAGAADLSYSVSEALPANGTMSIAVYANLPTTIGTQDTVITRLTVSGTSQNSGSAVSSTADVVGQTISAGTGTLAIAVDASSPVVANVVGNSEPKIASVKYTGSNDTFTLKEIGVTVGANGATAIQEIIFKDGSLELARVAMNVTAATATGLSVVVPYNGTKVIDIYAKLGSIGIGYATTSANVAATVSSTKYLNSAGSTLWLNTGSIAGTAQYVFKTKPTITNVALPTTVLTTGTVTVAKFTITADAGGTVAWRKLILTIASSTPVAATSFQVTGYAIYDAANEATALANVTATDPTSGATASFISASVDQEISGSKTYVVKATIAGAGVVTGASLGHKIATGQTAVVAPNGYIAAAAASPTATFVWSDESGSFNLAHSGTTADWMGDWLVKNLPTDQQTLSK